MHFAVGAAAVLLGALHPALAQPPPSAFQVLEIDELAWLAPGAGAAEFLTSTPPECLAPESHTDTDAMAEIGRAAFRSPLLLGGQAARHGLSCNSCHRNGHDNPAFFLDGLSGAPGTADVTHSLFSKSREDKVLNPVPIPTLLNVGGNKTFGTVAPASTLEAFIKGAIIEEFQGTAPNDTILFALAEYVRRLDRDQCPDGHAAITLDTAISDLKRTLTAALWAIENGQNETAGFLILSAQRIAGDTHDRYAAPGLSKQREALTEFARALGGARSMLKEDPTGAQAKLARSLEETPALRRLLKKKRRKSLYHRKTIDAALKLRQ